MTSRRILYVGWGFTPFRGGGSVHCAEALMHGMAGRGHAVAHFCTGRYGVPGSHPRLSTWARGPIREYELRDSPILPTWGLGTKTPRGEISCPEIEAAFRRAIADFKPDVVHFHEFMTMPASLATVAREEGIPYLCSLHDYGTVCATCLLFKHDRTVCTDYREGRDCVRCCAQAPPDSALFRLSLWAHSAFDGRPPAILAGAASFAKRLLRKGGEIGDAAGDAEGFVLRRKAFHAALAGARAVLPVSRRVAELFAIHGADTGNFRVVHPSLPHIDTIARRVRTAPEGRPIRLGFLGMCLPTKGVGTLFEGLSRTTAPAAFELTLHGACDPVFRDDLLRKHPSVRATFAGAYGADALNGLLDRIDVGLFPSLTEETFGLVGIEFLSAGIPVVASRIGAIPEYVVDGENGLLFTPGDAGDLARTLDTLAAQPDRIAAMSAGTKPAAPFAAHLDAMERFLP
jgi:glycosyltransferase involved in cell wall biosynthesis